MRVVCLCLVLLATLSACSSASSGASSEDQASLEEKYAKLQDQQEDIAAEMSKVKGTADSLYKKASSLEKSKGLAVGSATRCSYPASKQGTSSSYYFGPLKLKYKTKSLYLKEGGQSTKFKYKCSTASTSTK